VNLHRVSVCSGHEMCMMHRIHGEAPNGTRFSDVAATPARKKIHMPALKL